MQNPVKHRQCRVFCENSKQLKTVNYFFRNAPSQMFECVRNMPLAWMYLIIFRRVSSAGIYLNTPEYCVIVCQKIVEHKLSTFIVP